jgi:hypothetical protein
MNTKNTLILTTILVGLGVSSRLLSHPANFAPIGAIALFAGLYMPRRTAIIATLLPMLLSDMIIGFYHWQMMISVYACFTISIYLGSIVKQKTLQNVVGATIVGSIIFFIVTNAAVWAFGTMYTKTFTGLMESYTMALPFFRNSLIGDFFFVGILVGGMETIKSISKLATTKTVNN